MRNQKRHNHEFEDGQIVFDIGIFIFSILLAIVVATVGLTIVYIIEGVRASMFASVIIAVAVCSVHYTGMYAFTYCYNSKSDDPKYNPSLWKADPLIITLLGSSVRFFLAQSIVLNDRNTL